MLMHLEILSHLPDGPVRPVPVLFVHGAGHGAWCWENFLPYFASQGYAAYALSLQGHAGSHGRERLWRTRVHDYVNDVLQVIASLPCPPILVGHSMGGLVIQKVLETLAAPAAVLMASVPPWGYFPTGMDVARQSPLTALKVLLSGSIRPVVESPQLVRQFVFSPDSSDAVVQRTYERLGDEAFLAFFDLTLLELPHPGRIRSPLLVLGGADDRLIRPGDVRATARIYRTRAEIFPRMAHNMMLDTRWQAVADRILVWLSQTLADESFVAETPPQGERYERNYRW